MLEVLGRCVSLILPLLVLSLLLVYVYRRACFWIALRWLPGPPALPLLGNALQLTGGQDGKSVFIRPLLRITQLSDHTNKKQKQTPRPLVRERTIPTDRPPLVDEI
jgi:hypothetical protein